MNNSYFKLLFIFGALMGVFALIYGLYTYFEPVSDISKQKTDIQLTGEQLLRDFETDSKQAELKYRNKVLEISGTITKIECDSAHCKIIFDKKGKFIVVSSCADNIQKEVRMLKQNQAITVKGIYTGFVILDDLFMIPGEIKIDQCTILK